VEKVWVSAVRVFKVVMPPSAALAHVPSISSKHPPVSLIPLSRVDVAPDESCSDPPVIDIPSDVVSPPRVMPPVKVDVPESVESIVPPETVNPAVDCSPPVCTPPVNVDVAVVVAVSAGRTSPVYRVDVGVWKEPILWIDKVEPGDVVAIPNSPPEVRRMASVRVPDLRISKARSAVPAA